MVEAKETGERTGPVAGEQPDSIVGVDEVHRGGAHIKDTEDASLERDFPLAIQRSRVAIKGKRFSKIGRAGIPRLLAE